MLKDIIYFSGSITVFFFGLILYGVILNSRELTLNEEMENKGIDSLANVSIVVKKNLSKLELYSDSTLVKVYKVGLGKRQAKYKLNKYDFVTPVGTYFICKIDSNYDHYKMFQINYPNRDDLAEALKNGLINENEYQAYLNSMSGGDCEQPESDLSVIIGIHGIGTYNWIFKNLPFVFHWTNGSITLSDENIDELSSVIKLGTKVTIVN